MVLAACGPTGPSSSGPSAGQSAKIVIGQSDEEATLDPNITNSNNWRNVLLNMYDALTARDKQNKLVGQLAESWTTTSPTTWVFKIRKGVKFHNGDPLDASDVKFTLDRVRDPELKSLQAPYIASYDSVQVVDPYTIQITTKTPDPFVADNLQLVPIASQKYVTSKDKAALGNTENGTGPYKLTEWVKGDHMTLAASNDYWQGAPKIGTVVFRVIPEASALFAALRTGEVDIALSVPPDSAKQVTGAEGFEIKTVPSQRSFFVVLDSAVKPLNDVRVRQALNYAVDKQAITAGLLLGYADPIPSLLGPMYLGDDKSLKPYPYDPAKAKQLLAAAGYPDGFSLTLNAYSGQYPKDKEVAQAVAGMLEKVGVKVNLSVREWGTFINEYRLHNLSPAYFISFGLPIWDYSQAFRSYLTTLNPASYYRDAELERMSRESLTIVDAAQREKLLVQINGRIYNDAAFIFLYLGRTIFGVSKKVQWEPRTDERVWLYDVSMK